MEIFIGLAVIVIILLGAHNMTAIARLTASVAAIGIEVGETAQAIRDHINGDAGISQSALSELADRLDAAAATLNGLQGELGGDQPAGGSDSSVIGASASNMPASDDLGASSAAPGVDPAVASNDAGGDQSADGFGNQSGIGSDFEQGAGGDHIDLNSQSDTPADANGGQPANEPSVDAGNGQPGGNSDPE